MLSGDGVGVVSVGDTVLWAGGFGAGHPRLAVIESIQVTELPREKYGTDVGQVSWKRVMENRVVFSLTNGHWAYAEQITPADQRLRR